MGTGANRLRASLTSTVLVLVLASSLVTAQQSSINIIGVGPKKILEGKKLLIDVSGKDAYSIEGKVYREGELKSVLKELKAEERSIHVRTHPDTAFGQIRELLLFLGSLGLQQFVAEPNTTILLSKAGISEFAMPVSVFCLGNTSYECPEGYPAKKAHELGNALSLLKRAVQEDPTFVVVKADKDTPWVDVLTACQQAQRAGFKDVLCGDAPDDFKPNAGPRTHFFGIGARGHHICYVIDRSGSMIDVFHSIRLELMTSISRLRPIQDFNVILMGDGPPKESDSRRLAPAIDKSKEEAAKFLDPIKAEGKTDAAAALARAFDVLDQADPKKPGKVIYLLTDGPFADSEKVLKVIRERNAKKDVLIYTLLYANKSAEAEKILKQIAQENGGRYKFVSADE